MSKTFIVTGAYGHLGSTIVAKLLKKGEKVRALIMENEKPSRSKKDFEGVELFTGDISKKETLMPLFAGNDEKIVIHTAGIVSIENKIDKKIYETNVNGTKNIISLCKENKAKLLYVSSVHAIPQAKKDTIVKEPAFFDPKKVKGAYAKSKCMATIAVMDAIKEGLDAVIVFPSGIIGPFDSGRNHLVAMIKDIISGKLRALIKGGYDIVDVRDVADGCIAAATQAKSGELFILSNTYCSIQKICDIVTKQAGIKPIKAVLPTWFAAIFAPLCEAYYKVRKVRPLYTAYSIYVVKNAERFDNSKAVKKLGFHPRKITDSIKDTVIWLLKNCNVAAPKRLVRVSAKI